MFFLQGNCRNDKRSCQMIYDPYILLQIVHVHQLNTVHDLFHNFEFSNTHRTKYRQRLDQGPLQHVGGPRPGPMWETLGISIQRKCDISPSIWLWVCRLVHPQVLYLYIKCNVFPSGCPFHVTVDELLNSRGRRDSLERSGLCRGLRFTLQFPQYQRRSDAAME